MNEECISCEWYNKPYWSIISPCTNCTKRFNKKSVTVTQYSINIDKKELHKEIEQLQQENQSLKDRIEKANDLIDTILTFNLFGDECPLNFGFQEDSLQEKAQGIFYDGEYCENNCNNCCKKCWLKFFERIQELKGSDKNE